MIKTLKKLTIEGMYHNLIRVTYAKPVANIIMVNS